ncbi:MAG TPA: HEAT repeat domain-containing protein, partial [Candidatus Eremiobacteraeota bacterium]|nr:HEAT repeat domain-containing protein [Candidatus Eremiobacteraeota bacterium]
MLHNYFMELEIFFDRRGGKLKQDFTEDFDIECPFCSVIDKYIISKPKDLYCKNCKELIIIVIDRNLIKLDRGPQKSLQELIDLLHNGETPNERQDAAVALGETGDMTCVSALIQASMTDTKKNVRDQAMKALKRLKEVQEEKTKLKDTSEFFKDVQSIETSHPEAITSTKEVIPSEEVEKKQIYFKLLKELMTASDIDIIRIVKEQGDKLNKDFLKILDEEIKKATELNEEKNLSNLVYVSQILDNLNISQTLGKKSSPVIDLIEKVPEITDPYEEIIFETEQIEFLKELLTASDTEIIQLAKEKEDKFDKNFFKILNEEIQIAMENENKQLLDSLIYVSQILDNLKIYQIPGEELLIEEPPEEPLEEELLIEEPPEEPLEEELLIEEPPEEPLEEELL